MSYVLLVEDDLPTQRGILKLLAVLRYDACGVPSAAEAVTAVRKSRPALVLSDFLLPKLDALWLLKQVRAEWPDLPVIVMTGAILPEATIQEARNYGAVGLLPKPFTRQELDDAVRLALGRNGH